MVPVSLDAEVAEGRWALEPAHDLTPERIFERQWALTVIEQALARLALNGTEGVTASHVRVGKVVRLALEAPDRAAAERALEALADRVLANPNIESFTCTVGER